MDFILNEFLLNFFATFANFSVLLIAKLVCNFFLAFIQTLQNLIPHISVQRQHLSSKVIQVQHIISNFKKGK